MVLGFIDVIRFYRFSVFFIGFYDNNSHFSIFTEKKPEKPNLKRDPKLPIYLGLKSFRETGRGNEPGFPRFPGKSRKSRHIFPGNREFYVIFQDFPSVVLLLIHVASQLSNVRSFPITGPTTKARRRCTRRARAATGPSSGSSSSTAPTPTAPTARAGRRSRPRATCGTWPPPASSSSAAASTSTGLPRSTGTRRCTGRAGPVSCRWSRCCWRRERT